MLSLPSLLDHTKIWTQLKSQCKSSIYWLINFYMLHFRSVKTRNIWSSRHTAMLACSLQDLLCLYCVKGKGPYLGRWFYLRTRALITLRRKVLQQRQSVVYMMSPEKPRFCSLGLAGDKQDSVACNMFPHFSFPRVISSHLFPQMAISWLTWNIFISSLWSVDQLRKQRKPEAAAARSQAPFS